jgi:hypothetical protein
MLESNGLLTIAFRRTFVERGIQKHRTDIEGLQESEVKGQWLTTPWAYIEPAMAFQLGLPILIIREEGVLADGMIERGVAGLGMPVFNLDRPIDEYFNSVDWRGVIQKWEGYVRAVLEKKGRPPQLF